MPMKLIVMRTTLPFQRVRRVASRPTMVAMTAIVMRLKMMAGMTTLKGPLHRKEFFRIFEGIMLKKQKKNIKFSEH